MQHKFADRLLHDFKLSENVNVSTPQSLILRQVASARAVITDLLSSSTERTLAMSRIQILWLSNQISANTHLNIYQKQKHVKVEAETHISKTMVLFHLITTPRSSVASHHQFVWHKMHELSRLPVILKKTFQPHRHRSLRRVDRNLPQQKMSTRNAKVLPSMLIPRELWMKRFSNTR